MIKEDRRDNDRRTRREILIYINLSPELTIVMGLNHSQGGGAHLSTHFRLNENYRAFPHTLSKDTPNLVLYLLRTRLQPPSSGHGRPSELRAASEAKAYSIAMHLNGLLAIP
jgi:hypothetical protein